VSCIEWVRSQGTVVGGLITAGADKAVVYWEDASGGQSSQSSDLKWRLLHRDHRSEVKTVCVHSQGNHLYTGGMDGLVVQYDFQAMCTKTMVEMRKPNISKINAVLEHPHNPNVLLISAVDPMEQSLYVFDIRQGDKFAQKTMRLSWSNTSGSKPMSQYILPRWSPAGMHVSCGSNSGCVNIWDVRARGSEYPCVHPHQSIRVHGKQNVT
jgi:WD40 repeat protein